MTTRGRIYPIYSLATSSVTSGVVYFYRMPDPADLNSNWNTPWVLSNQTDILYIGPYELFEDSPVCPEYVTSNGNIAAPSTNPFRIQCKTSREKVGLNPAKNIKAVKILACSGTPLGEAEGATRTWDNTNLWNSFAQYTCPDGSFQYAVCEQSGWVYYSMGLAGHCYGVN